MSHKVKIAYNKNYPIEIDIEEASFLADELSETLRKAQVLYKRVIGYSLKRTYQEDNKKLMQEIIEAEKLLNNLVYILTISFYEYEKEDDI